MAHVLVLDDDRAIRRTLEKFLQGDGHEVTTTGDVAAALEAAPTTDLMLLDLGLPTTDGLEVLERLRVLERRPSVVVISARDDMDSAVRAVQLGAYDYLVKPLDVERVRLTMRRALESREATRALHQLSQTPGPSLDTGSFVGRSTAVRELYKTIGAVSMNRASVLILGESGTGKELVARAIHRASGERERPFVAVNCASFARELLESELFGHARGAFTGATSERAGRFELAGHGTLFLDEIAEMPLDLQAKLLRVLQERIVERVGDARPIRVHARIVAATHRDLGAMVAEQTFRADLYYRLNVVAIRIPPLRERRDDIPILAATALRKIAHELEKPVPTLTPDAMRSLEEHDWPGNVRELENVLTRAMVLATEPLITADHLYLERAHERPLDAGEDPGVPATDAPLQTLRELERAHIARVLSLTGWNKRRACAILAIARPTLDRKIEDYGLVRPGG